MSESSDESEDSVGDRRSVVRTAPPSVDGLSSGASGKDFGFDKLKTRDARKYLAKKKASGVVNLAYEKQRKSAAALQEIAERRQRAMEALALQRAGSMRRTVAEVAEAAASKPEHALWLLMGVPLFMLALAELVNLTVGTDGADGADGLSGTVLFGVALTVTASSLNALGLNFQRLGQQREQLLADADSGNLSGSQRRARAGSLEALAEAPNLNTIGIALAASAGVLDLVSMSFAPQSLLAPFGAVTLLVNLLLAPLLHGERLSRVDVGATALVCVGIAIALTASPGANPRYTLRSLLALFESSTLHAYLAAYAVALAALAQHIKSGEDSGRGSERSVGAAYPILSGMLGGLTTLCAKTMTELFKVTSLRASPQLLLPTILGIACFALAQTAVLNRGLGRHSSLFVVPLFSASFLLANLLGGGIAYNEFASFEQQQLIGFLLGVSLVVAGVTTLATKEEGGSGSSSSSRKKRSSSKRGSKKHSE